MTNSLNKIFICCFLLLFSGVALAGFGPDYSSKPASVQLTTVQNSSNPSKVINISNVGEKGSTLSGRCIKTTDPDNVFTITPSSLWTHTPGASPVAITVSCDSTKAIGMYTGTMECTHDGNGVTESSPVTYPLSCDITPTPRPAYSSTSTPTPLVLNAVQVNDPEPSATLTITNIGDSGTTLTGSCSANSPQFYIPNAVFSVSQNANQDVSIICNTSTPGIYSGTVSCSHNGANTPSPVTYPVTCKVAQADYSSTLASVQLTTVQNTSNPSAVINISNIGGIDSTLSGNCIETADPDNVFTITSSSLWNDTPGGSPVPITVSCDSTKAIGTHTGIMECTHDGNGVTESSPVTYPLSCDIRAYELPQGGFFVIPLQGGKAVAIPD